MASLVPLFQWLVGRRPAQLGLLSRPSHHMAAVGSAWEMLTISLLGTVLTQAQPTQSRGKGPQSTDDSSAGASACRLGCNQCVFHTLLQEKA